VGRDITVITECVAQQQRQNFDPALNIQGVTKTTQSCFPVELASHRPTICEIIG